MSEGSTAWCPSCRVATDDVTRETCERCGRPLVSTDAFLAAVTTSAMAEEEQAPQAVMVDAPEAEQPIDAGSDTCPWCGKVVADPAMQFCAYCGIALQQPADTGSQDIGNAASEAAGTAAAQRARNSAIEAVLQRSTGSGLIAVAGLCAIISSFLPWVTIHTASGSVSHSGIDWGSNGWIVAALGLVLFALAMAHLTRRRSPSLHVVMGYLVGAVLLGAMALTSFVEAPNHILAYAGGTFAGTAGAGMYLLFTAAILAYSGGLWEVLRRQYTERAGQVAGLVTVLAMIVTGLAVVETHPVPISAPGTSTTASPTLIPFADAASSQQGDLHLCLAANYDATSTRCRRDDTTVARTQASNARIVWPRMKGGTRATTVRILERDSAGVWQVISSAALDAGPSSGAAQGEETIEQIFADAQLAGRCNTAYLIRVVNRTNHRFGQTQMLLSC